jgi:tetratricopeptide (TPR) repeat protein
VSDYDLDGDVDVLLVRRDTGVQLLRNDMQSGHWLKLVLRRRTAAGALAPAWGAGVLARAGSRTFRRSLSSASYLSQSSSVLHLGLGAETRAESVAIRWQGYRTTLKNLESNRTWEIVIGEDRARTSTRPAAGSGGLRNAVAGVHPSRGAASKRKQIEFWALQRAGMDALKQADDPERAATLLRQALDIDGSHEDTRYYLGSALARLGDAEGALRQFDELRRISPQSHRAHARWGTLRADTASSREQLAAAEGALATAHGLNPEETGALQALGEVRLLQGAFSKADESLIAVSRSNPRSAHALFLRGYIRWKRKDAAAAEALLEACRKALGPEWKPAGTTAEGDVKQRAHAEHTPLARFVDEWNGRGPVSAAYAGLDRHLNAVRRGLRR